MLVSSSQSITQNLDALAVVVREISTRQLRSNLAFILTLSISTPFVVQTPDFGNMLILKHWLRLWLSQSFKFRSYLVFQILNFK